MEEQLFEGSRTATRVWKGARYVSRAYALVPSFR